MMHKHKN